jgi:hypothetical protein
MSDALGTHGPQEAQAPTARPARRWPGRPLLATRLREILRREFGAADAWVVHTPGRCRLEIRDGWRVVVLLEADEQAFWAPFYTEAVRNRFAGGYLVAELAPTQRRRQDLIEVLRPLWMKATAGEPATPAD